MDTVSNLTWGLRILFLLAMTAAIRQGSLFAIAMCAIIFLIIEYFLEDLASTSPIK